MIKKVQNLEYRLNKEKTAWGFVVMIAMSLTGSISCLVIYILEHNFNELLTEDIREYTLLAFPFLCAVAGLLYSYYSRMKRGILFRFGVRNDAEIVKARYGSPGRWGTPSYYLEIDFTNSRGKKKTIYTPAYEGNPNDYLKSAKCSVYEWKGFYVEADLQVRDEVDPFGYAGIPTEKKHFIWR